jgi:hypothetical protein
MTTPDPNAPNPITAPLELLQPAIAELLRRIPDTWQIYRPDDLTETQSRALYLLVGASCVERRCRSRMRMVNHPVMVDFTFTVTGTHGLQEALEKLCAAMWTEWHDAHEEWNRGDTAGVSPVLAEQLEPSEWRLTPEGVQSRKQLDGDEQERAFVLDWVLRRGIFDGQPRLIGGQWRQYGPVPGRGTLVRMEKVRVDAAVTGMVNVGNWGEGANAFAKAFEGMQAKTAAAGTTAAPPAAQRSPEAKQPPAPTAAQPKADTAEQPPADDGTPFYKPSHFKQWNVGDELLRKNATDLKKFTEGKVRRQRKRPSSTTAKSPAKGKRRKGKVRTRPVYWYSEPDARKRWPDRFAATPETPPKS